MAIERPRLYVGCSLTQAPEEFKNDVAGFKEALREKGYEVFDFVGLVKGSAEDVYRWDIEHCVRDCDALIGICDFPSIGLGFELNEAIRLKKPVLAVAHEDASVTRLLLGAAAVESNLAFERYTSLQDVIPQVEALLPIPMR